MKKSPDQNAVGNHPSLNILGGFEFNSATGEPIRLKTRKAQVLLAYLALGAGSSQLRSKLTGLLWSTRSEEQASASLRQALSELRKSLLPIAPTALVIDRQSATLDVAVIQVDALRFEELVRRDDQSSLSQASDLYRGDLLDGIYVRDPECERWITQERERLRVMAIESVSRLLGLHDVETVHTTARLLLRLDPLHESAHRALIRHYADSNQRSHALRQFESYRDTLEAELGVAPDPETEALYRSIRDNEPRPADSIKDNDDMGDREAFGVAITSPAPGHADDAISARQYAEDVPLADVPSIAVLPFTNMSGDPEQEFFSDGITEDIITALSRISNLLVAARHSTLAYKGQAIDIKQIGQEQGVRYVLEGSVRIRGNRIRVTAQLIDTCTGHHCWADHYDRDPDDIFAVQDEITLNITIAMQVALTEGEQARVYARGTTNVEAWECVVRGKELFGRHVKEDNLEALRLLERAVDLDPTYATAWAFLGWTHWENARWGWDGPPGPSLDRAFGLGQKALGLDSAHADSFALLGLTHLLRGELDEALAMTDKAVTLAPNHSHIAAISAMALRAAGKMHGAEALRRIKRAIQLSPIYPMWYLMMLGSIYHLIGDQKTAVETLRDAAQREPEAIMHKPWLASALVAAQRLDEARSVVADILRVEPGFSRTEWANVHGFRDPEIPARLTENLAKVGLPK